MVISGGQNRDFHKMDKDWRDVTRREALNGLTMEIEKLLKTSPPPENDYWQREMGGFKELFVNFLHQKPIGTVDWGKIEPPPDSMLHDYSTLQVPEDPAKIKQLLSKLVVVKLNGGLGTSMGCKGPKSLIPVRNELTFLDLTLQQINTLNSQYGTNLPLALMNSFNTHEDSDKALRKYKKVNVHVHTFNQSQYPRIDRETFMPTARSLENRDLEEWYPPGHGNFYEAFYNSGLLDKFLSEGKEYCFVSNIDNMGATVDLSMLNFLLGDGAVKHDFVMEVTDKTRADVKGGTLVRRDDKLMLLEIAQVPKDYVEEFKSVSKFRIFNTNNLWVKLSAIKELIEAKTMDMEIIVNPKHLPEKEQDILQLETAAGAAIKNFSGACGVNVPRSRFLPVKKCQDLLLLKSNLYDIHDGTLTLSGRRHFKTTPLVKLGTSFDKVDQFLNRFAGMPDLLELDHLTVSGDVTFGKSVSLKGTVIVIANHGDRIDIPPGAILENKIVSGNLRILDH